jgi:hypothetical protein
MINVYENKHDGTRHDDLEFEINFDEDSESYEVMLRHQGEYTGVVWHYANHEAIVGDMLGVDSHIQRHWEGYLKQQVELNKRKAVNFPLLLALVGKKVAIRDGGPGEIQAKGYLHLVDQDIWQVEDDGEYLRFSSIGVEIDDNEIHLLSR